VHGGHNSDAWLKHWGNARTERVHDGHSRTDCRPSCQPCTDSPNHAQSFAEPLAVSIGRAVRHGGPIGVGFPRWVGDSDVQGPQ
jgi:hypothetical protein